MKKTNLYHALRLVCMGCLFLIAWLPVNAQGDNLLENPGFEAPFNTLDGVPPRQVAQGWTPWHIPAPEDAPTFVNAQPDYQPVAPDATRIRDGNNAQLLRAFYVTFDGGVYQRVTGVSAGASLLFSTYAYVWSSTYDETDLSELDGDVFVQVGIDPTGGTDPESANIVWSAAGVENYDAYSQYSVEAEAGGSAITVFVRATIGEPVRNTHLFLDEASLTTDGEVEPGATVTDEPVEEVTSTPTEDTLGLTATSIVAMATETEAAAQTATANVPPPSPTVTATATATATQTATATPTTEPDESTPTEDTLGLTATSIVAMATETEAAAQTATANVPPPSPTATATATATATVTAETNLTATAIVVAATRTTEANLTATAIAGEDETDGPINDLFPSTIIHTVQWGETVSILAARYGSTIQAIAEANGLDENYLIRVGQGLIIPVRLPAPATSTPTHTPVVVVVTATPGGSSGGITPPGTDTYVVRFGDTLSQIAQRFNTTVRTLAQLNGIVNVNSIQVGQVLRLPGSGAGNPPTPTPAPVTRYVVQPGDSLYRISLLFGVSIAELIQANNITNPNFIFVGQTLIIP